MNSTMTCGRGMRRQTRVCGSSRLLAGQTPLAVLPSTDRVTQRAAHAGRPAELQRASEHPLGLVSDAMQAARARECRGRRSLSPLLDAWNARFPTSTRKLLNVLRQA